jgi:hypothetical protein
MGMQVSLLHIDLHSFGYMLKNGMTGHNVGFIFSIFMNLHSDFHRDCTNSHSHQQGKRDPLSLHPNQYLLLFS